MEYSAIDNGPVENHLVQWEGYGPCLVCRPALRPYARMKDKGSQAFGGESARLKELQLLLDSLRFSCLLTPKSES